MVDAKNEVISNSRFWGFLPSIGIFLRQISVMPDFLSIGKLMRNGNPGIS